MAFFSLLKVQSKSTILHNNWWLLQADIFQYNTTVNVGKFIAMNFLHMFLLMVAILTTRSRVVGGARLVRKERSISGRYLIVMKNNTTAAQVDEFMKGLKNLSDSSDTPYKASHMGGLYTISKGITGELNQDALDLVRLIESVSLQL